MEIPIGNDAAHAESALPSPCLRRSSGALQTTNANMTSNLVTVVPYKGTTWYLDLTVILVSVFFVVFMGGYLVWEHQAKKNK